MNKEYKESKIGLVWSFGLIIFFVGLPYYAWLHAENARTEITKEYNALKKEVDYTHQLLEKIDYLLERNAELAKAENEYVGKYCSMINFNSPECTDYIKKTTKATIDLKQREKEVLEKLFNTDNKVGAGNGGNPPKQPPKQGVTKSGIKYKVVEE